MFKKEKDKIVVVHFGNVMHYPPVINLLDCLLTNGYKTMLISEGISDINPMILNHANFSFSEIVTSKGNSKVQAVIRNLKKRAEYRKIFRLVMSENDILWTTNDNAVAALSNLIKPYQKQHVLQLMELVRKVPVMKGVPYIAFPIESYARESWRTVVPERNRAYIQKVLWRQEKIPFVLPNKPYRLDAGEITEDIAKKLQDIQNERRKIVLYLGVVGKDRDLSCFVDAIDMLGEDYCLYIIGRVVPTVKNEFEKMILKHDNVRYLGFFNPPGHLHFVKYAHVALLPYKPAYNIKSQSPLNALYCAPNKIFEYAGYGVPMVGTDVLGLREPFERYNIGICCSDLSPTSIASAIQKVAQNHSEMSARCLEYYGSVDFDKIVNSILLP